MRKTLLVVTALLLIFCFEGIQAQSVDFPYWYGMRNQWGMNSGFDFNTSGKSGRSIAMGGTYYALNNEGYGAFLNAAGMVQTQKALMSLSTLVGNDAPTGAPFSIPTLGFSDTITTVDVATGVNEFDNSHVQIDQGGAVTPFYYFNREWWAGAGYRKAFDMYTEYTMPYYIEGQEAFYTQHGSIDAISGAIATKIMPNFSIGVNMNLYVRGYEQNVWFPVPYSNSYGDTLFVNNHMRDKSTFNGSNFDFSGFLDFDMVKVGFNISTAFTLTQKTLYNIEAIQDDGSPNGTIDRITAKNKFPMTFGGGVAFTPNEQVTLAIDVTHKPFSKVKIDIDPQQNMYNDITDYDPNWEDLTQIRIGAEYILDFESFDIPLRAGLQNIPGLTKATTYIESFDTTDATDFTIFSSYDDSTSSGDQFNTYLFSFGSGLKFQKIWFDFAYQFGKSEYDQTRIVTGNIYTDQYTWHTKVEQSYSRFYISASMLF